jgi:hypothetical protein
LKKLKINRLYHWKITKYNPQLRTPQGNFLANEWTSYSDIGTFYNNKQFTQKNYLDTENAYVNAVINFMDCLKISSLKIVVLEKFNEELVSEDNHFQDMISLINNIHTGSCLNEQQIFIACRLILREYIWAKLSNDKKMYVHFGYDYYMYIGSLLPRHETIQNIMEKGIFVEKFKSPYL